MLLRARLCEFVRERARGGAEGGGASCALENAVERGGGGDGRVYCSFQHLHATIKPVANGNAPVAINSNTSRVSELAVAAAFGAYGSHMGAITVPQHLHAMIILISHKDVLGAVKDDAHGT